MTRSFCTALFYLLAHVTWAQNDFYREELLNLADVYRLPLYRNGDMAQLSSYDRTGGNDDGFSGKYSFIREEAGALVIADLKGPGVVNRIWTPTPTSDTVQFYFDGEKKPRIAVPFINLFSGRQYPFLAPLSGMEIGGYYCYLPIPYAKSLKIIYKGKNLRFHQIQFRTLSKQDNVKSFSHELLGGHKDVVEQVARAWSRESKPIDHYRGRLKSSKINVTIKPGEEKSLFELDRGGRIVAIELDAGNLRHYYRKIMLMAEWDNDQKKAIDVPLHDFFGYAFGKPSMKSMVLGGDDRKLYSYLPMPFDQSARIRVKYERAQADVDEVQVSGVIYYTEDKRNPATEGKLFVQTRRQYNIPSGDRHLIANIDGKGHYIGTILVCQGLEPGSTWYFEGDDKAIIDGHLKLHGTGSEDYFNGGWYAVMDRWDKAMSLPIHGSLAYDLMTSRTGGYRFYLADKLNFGRSFQLTIEHQPDKDNNVKTDYSSLGFFYADRAQYENTSLFLDNSDVVHYRDKLTPQGMVYSLYWQTKAEYEDPAILFSMKKSDAWYARIDPAAVPMVQVSLSGLDHGRYKLYVEYVMEGDSGPVSFWQRSTRISDWLSSSGDKAEDGKTVSYAGEIEITDEIQTITMRKRSEDTSIKIFSFFFERIQ